MNAADPQKTPKWTEIANDPDYQAADWQTRQEVRGRFFDDIIRPDTPPELVDEVQSKFFTMTEDDVFGGERGQTSSEQPSTPKPEEGAPGLVSNALRNAGERGLDLVGNALQFVGNAPEKGEEFLADKLGGINPGVVGGEADAMRERGYEPDVEVAGYGLDFTARANPEDTGTGLVGVGQAIEDVSLGYQPNYTIDRALDDPSLKTLAGAAAEQGPAALADMLGLVVNPPAYLAARTQEIGEARVANDGREGMPGVRDYAVSGPTAAASVLLDRFALGRLLPGGSGAISRARQIPGAIARAGATEATTEAIQEGGIEYAGESVGTQDGWSPSTAGRRAAGGAIVGGPTGGAVRAGTAAFEASGRRASPGQSTSEQQDTTPQQEPPGGQAETGQANTETVATAAELIRRPRSELSSAEREARDSITYGDAFKALRSAAEAQGDAEAVAQLDAASEEVSASLEDETLARSRGDEAAMEPVRQRLSLAAQRYTAAVDRINGQPEERQADSAPSPEAVIQTARQQSAEQGGDALDQAAAGMAAEQEAAQAQARPDPQANDDSGAQQVTQLLDKAAAEQDRLAQASREAGLESTNRQRRLAIALNRANTAHDKGDVAQAGRMLERAGLIADGLRREIEQASAASDPAGSADVTPTREEGPLAGTQMPAQAPESGVDSAAQGDMREPIFEQYPEGFRYVLRDPQAPRWQSEQGQAAADGEVGRIVGDERVDRLIIRNAGVQADYQGAGRATDAYADLANRAHQQGKTLASDVEVTPAAARIYERLETRGYQVERNPTARLEDVDGEQKWVTDRGAVFIVSPRRPGGEEGQAQAVSRPAARRHQAERSPQADTASPDLQYRANGQPFASERSARVSRYAKEAQRQGRRVETVEVEGGYALQVEDDQAQSSREAGSSIREDAARAELASEKGTEPDASGATDMEAAARAQKDEAGGGREAGNEQAGTSELAVDGDIRHSMADGASDPGSAPRAESIRARLAEYPELSVVEVVQSVRELPREVQIIMALQGVQGSDVSGVYNPATGAPMIVADNLIDEADAVRKAVHEGVGHYGIRGMLGKELEPLMLEIYRSHTRSEAGRANIDELQAAYPFIDLSTRKGRLAMGEELVAHYIEDSSGRPKLSQRIKSTIRRLLRKLFPGIQWRTSDILVMGDQARRWLRRQQAARDVGDGDNRYSFAKRQNELSAQDLAAQLREEYPGLKLDLVGRGQKVTLSRIVTPEREHGTGSEVMRRLAGWADATGRTLALTPSQDFGGNVKRLREFYRRFGFVENKGRHKDYEISEAMYREPDRGVGEVRFSMAKQPGTDAGKFSSADSTGFGLPDEAYRDAFMRNVVDKFAPVNRLQGQIKKAGGHINEDNDTYIAEELYYGKTENDLRALKKRFIQPLADGLAKADISLSDLDSFIYARHAPERNERIARRNPDDPSYEDGGSGMTNERAAEIMADIDASGKRAEFNRLANIVDRMLAFRREKIREGGRMSDEEIEARMSGFDHYVPLKGWARDEDVPTGEKRAKRPGTGRGFESSGKDSKIALGRKTVAASPVTQAIVDTTESVIKSRKNEVAQKVLSLVTDNPNPNLWEVFTDDHPDMARKEVWRTDLETGEKRLVVTEARVDMGSSDKYFKVKKNGRNFYIKIHNDQLMDTLRNLGTSNAGKLIEFVGRIIRVLSSLVTSWNPEFMVTNFVRDAQTAILNIRSEETRDDGRLKGRRIGTGTVKDMKSAGAAAYRGLSDKKGKSQHQQEWDGWFREFMEAGAKTGYFDVKDVEAQARDLEQMMKSAATGVRGSTRRGARSAVDFVENMNGAVENAVRLSAYKNAREAGLTRNEAASLAKNMTVNFNRRGEMSTTMGALYMFFNASVQGTKNFARTMGGFKARREDKSRFNVFARLNSAQKMAVVLSAGGFGWSALMRALSGEDEDGVNLWDKVPDHVKERNIVLMTGWLGGDPEDYVALPLPYGYNMFPLLGTSLESFISGGKTLEESAVNLSLGIVGSFNPVGFEGSDEALNAAAKSFTPTVARPFAQLAINENFFGGPIYKEDFAFGGSSPDSSRSFRSTPEAYKTIAEFLNQMTGGNKFETGFIDISPDTLQHLINAYGGGAWGFAEKSGDFAYRAATGDLEDIETRRIPFVGRVMGEADDTYGDQSRFYDRKDELYQRVNYLDSLRGPSRRQATQETPSARRLYNRATDLASRLSKIRDIRDRIEASERIPEAIKKQRIERQEARMEKLIDQWNRDYNEAMGD
ncbi:MAG: hypothetical protein CME72_12305 [Halomonadaceae bacterium]|nr:hypothetical protein [Halomonadaceae bacterium]